MSKSNILVTGRLWLGMTGTSSLYGELIDLIRKAKNEIVIVSYRFSGGAQAIVDELYKAVERGCMLTVVLDKSIDPEMHLLFKEMGCFAGVSVWEFAEITSPVAYSSLHAKIFMFDRRIAVVGSANVSRNGFFENHELAVKVDGKDVTSISNAIQSLMEHGRLEGVLIKVLFDS